MIQRTLRVFAPALVLVAGQVFAQPKGLPIIKADSLMVDVIEDGVEEKASWRISPELKPDVYTTNTHGARITFRTNRDSITVVSDSAKAQDFVIQYGKQKAWTRVEYKPTYLEFLRKATSFNGDDARPIPAFTYQSPDAPELMALRKAFNLDSIAGEGNEISRMLEVMHWLHDLVPHDGQHDNPVVKNALSMVAECKRDHRGLNCRGLATVLNECYLALGYKSRFLTCMPIDTTDSDCHVINIAWSNDLNKWIWLDPSHDAWVMDETGALLGPWEVRERLVAGEPLILNPAANWNHRMSTVREDYLLSYMAKNLYWLECPVESRYDTETRGEGKTIEYVQLLPLEHHTQKPDVVKRTGGSGNTIIEYRTNDPARFWAAPR
ncbi:MAG: transglutaminase domain-containing protein [Flavobacteriales bacterium]|nr:transglutaminase domain-containing protein [Flavobacteriales bacterium]